MLSFEVRSMSTSVPRPSGYLYSTVTVKRRWSASPILLYLQYCRVSLYYIPIYSTVEPPVRLPQRCICMALQAGQALQITIDRCRKDDQC